MGFKPRQFPALVLTFAAPIAWASGHPGVASTDARHTLRAPPATSAQSPDRAPSLLVASGSLRLETAPCPLDADPAPGHQVAVELWMRSLDSLSTGFQAFLEYDVGTISYRGDLSSYTFTPFAMHVQNIVTAEVSTGRIRVDGSDDFSGTGSDQDSLLATLVFDIAPDCAFGAVDFDLSQLFDSELSHEGDPLVTTLVNTGDFRYDVTPPTLGPCPNFIVPADPSVGDGCVGAFVTIDPPFLPAVEDNCPGPITVTCVPPSGTFFFVGGPYPVDCTATDGCGNETMCTLEVTVTATNVVDVEVELPGSLPATRCIHFVTDDCDTTVDAELMFVDHDDDPGTPVRAAATIEVDCGNWTTLCAKDEAHTLWDSTTMTVVDGRYVADAVLSLLPGDTNNDGDVDMIDVNAVLFRFGGPEPAGGCPWAGARGADFNNNGNVGSEDFSLLSANWMAVTSCACVDLSLDSNQGPRGAKPPTAPNPVIRVDPTVPRR